MNNKVGKLLIFGAVVSLAATAGLYHSFVTHPRKTLCSYLDLYGYTTNEQKSAFANILSLAGIDVNSLLYNPFNSDHEAVEKIIDLVEQTQSILTRRTGGQERYETTPTSWMSENTGAIFDNLITLGFTRQVDIPKTKTDALCIFGDVKITMQDRLNYAEELINNYGLQTKIIIFLVGDRDVIFEGNFDGSYAELAELAKNNDKNIEELTETDIARQLFAQHSLSNRKDLQVIFLDAPKIENKSRPTTESTLNYLIAWMENTSSVYKDLTFISSQPFHSYQEAITRAVFKGNGIKDIEISVVSPGADQIISAMGGVNPTVVKYMVAEVGASVWSKTASTVLEHFAIDEIDDESKKRISFLYEGSEALKAHLDKLMQRPSPLLSI